MGSKSPPFGSEHLTRKTWDDWTNCLRPVTQKAHPSPCVQLQTLSNEPGEQNIIKYFYLIKVIKFNKSDKSLLPAGSWERLPSGHTAVCRLCLVDGQPALVFLWLRDR